MSVQLPLPYIRPFGSKCFAGGLLHFRGSGFKARDLQEPASPAPSAAPCGSAARPIPFYVQNTRKERILVPPGAGLLLTTDPLFLTQKKANHKQKFSQNLRRFHTPFILYFFHSSHLLPYTPPRTVGT